MSDCTLSGNEVLRGEIKNPYQGAATAELRLDASVKPIGKASLQLLGRTWAMSVIAAPTNPAQTLSGDDAGFWTCRLVAGAGGLDKSIKPMEWAQGAVVSQILSYILAAGGEVQAADILQPLLGRAVPQWDITAGTVGGALANLVEYLGNGIVWRIRGDGKVWIGVPVPVAVPGPEYIVVAPGAEAGQEVWDLNDVSADVDQIINGLTLRQVIYSWEPSQLHALVTYAPGPVNALYGLFGQWLRRIGLDYFRSLPGRINSQNDSSSVQFQPDSSSYSPKRKVAIRYGLPDVDCTGLTGRGVAGWEGALATTPVLESFGPSPASKATKIKIAASQAPKPSARKGDAVGWLTLVAISVSGVTLVSSVGWVTVNPGLPPPPPMLAPGSYAIALSITDGSSVVEVGG